MKKIFSVLLVIVSILVFAAVPASAAESDFRPSCRPGDLFTTAYPGHRPSAFINHEGDIEVGGIVAVCTPSLGYAFKYEPKRAVMSLYVSFLFYGTGYTIQIRPLTRKTEFFSGERSMGDLVAKNNVGFKIILPPEVKDRLALYEYTDAEYISAAILLLSTSAINGMAQPPAHHIQKLQAFAPGALLFESIRSTRCLPNTHQTHY